MRYRSTQVIQQTISQRGLIRTTCTFVSKIFSLTLKSPALWPFFSLSICSPTCAGANQTEKKGQPDILVSTVRPALKKKIQIGPCHWTQTREVGTHFYHQDSPVHLRTSSYYSSNINNYTNNKSSQLMFLLLLFLQSTDHWGGNTSLCLVQWSHLASFSAEREKTTLETFICESVQTFG